MLDESLGARKILECSEVGPHDQPALKTKSILLRWVERIRENGQVHGTERTLSAGAYCWVGIEVILNNITMQVADLAPLHSPPARRLLLSRLPFFLLSCCVTSNGDFARSFCWTRVLEREGIRDFLKLNQIVGLLCKPKNF